MPEDEDDDLRVNTDLPFEDVVKRVMGVEDEDETEDE